MTASPRLQVGSLASGYVAAGLFWGALAAAAPDIQDRAGLGPAAFGLALATLSLAAFPVMRSVGARIHRNRRVAIPAALLAFAAGCLILSVARGAVAVTAALAVLGGASGALDLSLNLRTDRVEKDTGRRLFNLTHAIYPLTMLVSSAATGLARGLGAGPGAIFPVVAAAFLLVAAIEARAGAHQKAERDGRARPRPVPLTGGILVLGALAAMASFQEVAPQNWAAIFVEDARGAGPVLAGLAPAAFTLGMGLGRVGAHWAEDRIAPRRLLRAASAFSVAGFVAVALPVPPLGVLLACLVAGIGVGPVEPAVFRAAARRATGPMQGRVLASVTSVAYLGYLLSPPVLGLVADGLGWPALWLSAAAVAVAVPVVAGRLPARD